MKKALLIICVLLVAVVSTACINNFAVRDLNNKAVMYMEKGDYTSAIERLKSSLDLDSSVYETHYNLAVAYTKAEDYINAVDEYQNALKINPNSAEVYYSMATAQNNLIVDMEQGRVRLNIEDKLYAPEPEEIDIERKYKMSEKEQNYVNDLKKSAIENYEKYLELEPNSSEKDEVLNVINSLKGLKDQESAKE